MATLERRKTVAAVVVRVLLAADPEEPAVEQRDREREHPVPGERGLAEQPPDPAPRRRQRLGETEHLVELLAVAVLAPRGVVQVLAPPCLVGPDRLKVAVRRRADPHVPPRGRDREAADPLEGLGIPDRPSALVQIREAASPSAGG